MKPTVLRYTTKPEHTQRNAQLIEGVFRELDTAQPDGGRPKHSTQLTRARFAVRSRGDQR